jgi:hypothetical protein
LHYNQQTDLRAALLLRAKVLYEDDGRFGICRWSSSRTHFLAELARLVSQSIRNASIGLTDAARHAGRIAVPSATNAIKQLAMAIVGASTAAYSKELRLNQAAKRPSTGKRNSRSDAEHHQRFTHDQPNGAGARSAQSHANANLLRSTRHG